MRLSKFALVAVTALIALPLAFGADPPTGRDVGMVAPEITGKDIDGKAMKLSDFRGKIVVLDFFGDW